MIASLCLTLALPASGAAQEPHLAPNALRDRPVSATEAQWARAIAYMAPYVDSARATYPDARRRYLAGLPPKHSFFVTARLQDEHGDIEQIFIAVDSVIGEQIHGRIWNPPTQVHGYAFRQPYTLRESELIDWLIARPDGTEEGNIVGLALERFAMQLERESREPR